MQVAEQNLTIRGADCLLFQRVPRSVQSRRCASLKSYRDVEHGDLVLDAAIPTWVYLTSFLPACLHLLAGGRPLKHQPRHSPPSPSFAQTAGVCTTTCWEYSNRWRNSALADESANLVTDAFMRQVMAKSCVHLAVGQEFIMMDDNKIRIHMSEWKRRIDKKGAWHLPLGIFITLLYGSITGSFRDLLGFPGIFWESLSLFLWAASGVWLAYAAVQSRRVNGDSMDDFIQELKRGATRVDFSASFVAAESTAKIIPPSSQ